MKEKNVIRAEHFSCCSPTAARHCPVEATLNLIGGKYKALILWKLMGNTLRFSELHREVPCATPKMLTQQLRELEANGMLSRKVYPVVPPRVEYTLTDFGRSIRPVLESMYSWGSGYLARQGLEVNCTMEPLPIEAGSEAGGKRQQTESLS